MRPKTLFLTSGLVVAMLISACDVSFGGNPPPPREPDVGVTAGGPEDSAFPLTVPARGDVLVQVNVGSGPSLLTLEAVSDRDIELELGNASRRLLASSSSARFFAGGRAGLESSSLEGQSVNVRLECRGPCINVSLVGSSSDHYFAVVRNRSASPATVQFYAYRDIFQDEYEPLNDSVTTTNAVLDVNGFESGAIETVGDVDYWRVQGSGSVLFTTAPDSSIDIAMFVVDGSGQVIDGPYRSGSPVHLDAGEFVLVRAMDGRAGSSQESYYSFDGGAAL